MATYSAAVERWRPLVEKYVKNPAWVDKLMFAIQHESGGRPDAIGDNGVAIGLLQVQDNNNFPDRPDRAYLLNPENNIKYAAQQLGAANGDFSAWGDGASYQGQPFGAFGHNRYVPDGDYSGGGNTWDSTQASNMSYDPDEYRRLQEEVQQIWADWNEGGRDIDEYEEVVKPALESIAIYREINGIDDKATGSADANDAVSRWATIEGVDINRAQQAFESWKTKHDQAFEAANNEITAANGQNEERVAIQEARNASSTPGLLPRNVTAGTVAPKYADALAKWKKTYGATDEMPAASGYVTPPPIDIPGAPGTGGGTGGTGTPFPAAEPRKPGDPPGVAGGPENYGPAPGQYPTYKEYPSGTTVQTNPDGTRIGSGSWADDRPSTFQQGLDGNPVFGAKGPFDDGLGDFIGQATYVPRKSVTTTAGIGKKAGKWFKKRFFAEGGSNIPGGPGVVGENGPEYMYLPGFGMKVVGQNGPEQINIPEGASIIPMNEANAFQGIQQGMQGAPPPQDRANDPDVTAKAMAAMQSAVSAAYAMNPPSTPVPIDGSKDYFANWRELSGVPYDPMAAQQGGAPRG